MSETVKHDAILKKIFLFYYEGFKSMTWGRKVWIIIIIKLFIMFAVLRIFFFQDFLGSRFDTDREKSNYVTDELIKRNSHD